MTAAIRERLGSLGLRTNASHHPDLVDVPNECGLPVDRLDNALQGFICRDVIGAFLASDPGQRIGEQGVPPPQTKLDAVTISHHRSGTPFRIRFGGPNRTSDGNTWSPNIAPLRRPELRGSRRPW